MGVLCARVLLALSIAAALGFAPLAPAAGATGAVPRPCSSGLVALTFDDGPAAGLTPKLLDILTTRGVPATFFMVGERIASAPRAARRAAAGGFGIANHTYHHEQLTALSNSAIRATIRRARQAAADAGVRMSRLVRPPYGAINARVRSVITGMGLVPVLWTVDPQDWLTGRSSDAIASSVLAQLRPRRTNIVLLHDGVANSPRTVAAVPRIIRGARARGYCFARLGPSGRPVPPTPAVSVSDAWVRERTGSRSTLVFHLRLDRPTSRRTSILATTTDGAARAGHDYVARRVRVFFPRGDTHAVVRVPVVGDRFDEVNESMRLRLSSPHGLTIRRGRAIGTIRDDDPRPVVRLFGGTVTEPETGSVAARVRVSLSDPSGRTVSVRVRTVAATATAGDFTPVDATLTFPPGATSRVLDVPVLADDVDESEESFEVRIRAVTNAAAGPNATVSILPPPAVPAPTP